MKKQQMANQNKLASQTQSEIEDTTHATDSDLNSMELSACGWAAGWGTDKTANWLWAFDYFDARIRAVGIQKTMNRF